MFRKSLILAALLVAVSPAFAANSRAVLARPVETSTEAIETVKSKDVQKEREKEKAEGVAKGTKGASSVNGRMALLARADRIEQRAANDNTCDAGCKTTGQALHDVLAGKQGLEGDAAKKAFALAEAVDAREAARADGKGTDLIQKSELAKAGITEKALKESCLVK